MIFAVAAHGPVEALKVAIDDPDEVVEILARGKRYRASVSGSSVSPSPTKAQTLGSSPEMSLRARSNG